MICYSTLLALGYHISMDQNEEGENNRMKTIKLGNK